MKKVIIFTIVTMTAVLMLTASSFGQRRMGSMGGYQARRVSPAWVGQPVRREFRSAYRGGFQRDYSRRVNQMRRLNSLRYEYEARRAYRINRAIREARERRFIYARTLRNRGRY
jgi:hypothetical protein